MGKYQNWLCDISGSLDFGFALEHSGMVGSVIVDFV
jgi:hypothetical protein